MAMKKIISAVALAAICVSSVGATNLSAKPSSHVFIIDGRETPAAAYNINGNNYYKLRDIAFVMSGSDAQFNVEWNEKNGRIDVTTGQAYTPVGGELASTAESIQSIRTSTSIVYKDGEKARFAGYLINGNNYYLLRDLQSAFRFDLVFEPKMGSSGAVIIDRDSSNKPDYELPDYVVNDISKIIEEVNHSDSSNKYLLCLQLARRRMDEIRNDEWVFSGTDSMYQDRVDYLTYTISNLSTDDTPGSTEKIQKIKTELSDLNRAYDMKKELEALDDLPAKFLR